MKYQLLTKEFVPPKAGIIVRLGSFVILACIPKRRRESARQRILKSITRYNDQRDLEVVAVETLLSLRKPFAPDMLNAYVELPFEDSSFMCFADWDDHLRRKFGNYMQLPPEEERTWRHHPIIIDFEHNYEELHL